MCILYSVLPLNVKTSRPLYNHKHKMLPMLEKATLAFSLRSLDLRENASVAFSTGYIKKTWTNLLIFVQVLWLILVFRIHVVFVLVQIFQVIKTI